MHSMHPRNHRPINFIIPSLFIFIDCFGGKTDEREHSVNCNYSSISNREIMPKVRREAIKKETKTHEIYQKIVHDSLK